MKIACIGGGPAGLYFGLLMKKQDPAHEIVVVERNRPYDTFGWGVVFSDQTLGNLVAADEPTARTILQAFNHWDDIDVFFKGRRITSGGHGFCGIGRKRLLNILQARCEELGVKLVFETNVDRRARGGGAVRRRPRDRLRRHQQRDPHALPGRRSRRTSTRAAAASSGSARRSGSTRSRSRSRKPSTAGSRRTSTSSTATRRRSSSRRRRTCGRRAGLDRMNQDEGIAFCERLFAQHLDGHRLLSNASHLRGSAIWIKFPRIVCGNWVHRIDVERQAACRSC